MRRDYTTCDLRALVTCNECGAIVDGGKKAAHSEDHRKVTALYELLGGAKLVIDENQETLPF